MVQWHDTCRSSISCRSCRSRKVKCDRRFPICLVCEKTSQDCSYPTGPLKPGPKIGSLRQRKRSLNENDKDYGEEDRHTTRPRLESEDETTALAPDSLSLNSVAEREVSLLTESHDAPATVEEKVPDLAFILHPSHESPGSREEPISEQQLSGDIQRRASLDKACSVIKLTWSEVEKLIETYFDNMVAINLFHQPSFYDKLSRIASPTEVTALLAAMIAFSVRFQSAGNGVETEGNTHRRAAHFLSLASDYSNDALKECGDHTPPLCLLQAFILVSHGQLTQGVLGRAWRTLGTCVRLAYEMNLHLVDARGAEYALNSKRWREGEEKRRAWWAIWEMDVFATTIRRTPTAVDWSQLETLLPVDDEHWFESKPTRSCFLQQDPILRWKALANSGNQSPKAWFIVINSLMKEAQRISSPRGIPNGNSPSSDRMDEARQRLEVIANTVHCFQLALPNHLKYRQQNLGFDARVPGEVSSLRQIHCSIYNIYMMTQLARLMIYRYDVFKGRFCVALPTRESDINHDNPDINAKRKTERVAVNEYFEAADDMLTIIYRSCDDHIRYINPFLSNTIWLASAVHLMRSQLCRPGAVKSAVKSRYEVLHLTYKRCVRFWDMHTTVQQNLETLEDQLEAWQQSKKQCRTEQNHASSLPPRWEHSSQRPDLDDGPTLSVPNTISNDITTPVIPTPPSSSSFYQTDWHAEIPAGDIRNASMVDMLSVPSMDAHFITDQMIPSATLIDPMFLYGSTQSQGPWIENSRAMDGELDWGCLQLPNELSDVLF